MSDARRVIAITGAGGTLGAALSASFAGEPDTDVVLSDVSAGSLDATVHGLAGASWRGRDAGWPTWVRSPTSKPSSAWRWSASVGSTC